RRASSHHRGGAPRPARVGRVPADVDGAAKLLPFVWLSPTRYRWGGRGPPLGGGHPSAGATSRRGPGEICTVS
ncbi:MAG: hypothetical protein M0Z30_06840, partial [Actinomycetota bacterium]|nr:hypothetical protein [Actinomycetota bacterium]